MLTRDEVLKVLTILGDAYPAWAERSSKTLPATWQTLLGDIPLDRLLVAAVAHAQSSQFPPTVAELRSRAEPRLTSAPEEAWALCRKAAGYCSPYASDERYAQTWAALEAKDPCAAEALRSLGGFSLFHGQLTEDVSTNRAHFARAYTEISNRRLRQAQEERAVDTLERAPQISSGMPPPRVLRGGAS